MRSLVPVCLLVGGLFASPAGANPLDHFRTDDVGPHKVPHKGTVSVLVIPTRVGDDFPEVRMARLRALYDPDGGRGTFRGYWRAVSNGQYDPIPVLADPVLFDSCPLPDREEDNCTIALTDIGLLTSGAAEKYFEALLEDVRDVQGIDLAQFDTTGAMGEPDGFFDGVIVDSDLLSGVGLPLQALTIPINAITGDGDPIVMANVAMAPPDEHEFGHVLGFIDLYNGPTINDLMGDFAGITLSAFSRQQIGWGETVAVEAPGVFDLDPVMAGGKMLRVGEAPRYLLIEHRGGAAHALWDRSPPGIYVYAIDESTLPRTLLGFLDLPAQTLYFPNQKAPYLNVNLPLNCVLVGERPGTRCVMDVGGKRNLAHPDEGDTGWTLSVLEAGPGERLTVAIHPRGEAPPEVERPEPDAAVVSPGVDGGVMQGEDEEDSEGSAGSGGCSAAALAGQGPWGLSVLGLLGLLAPGRRRHLARV